MERASAKGACPSYALFCLGPLACPRADDGAIQWIAAEIKQFFESRSEVDILFPWTLTMVSALRFGGNALHDGRSLIVLDHDIDIALGLLWNDTTSQREVERAVFADFVTHLRSRGRYVVDLSWRLQIAGLRLKPCIIIVEPRAVQSGWMQATEEVSWVVWRQMRERLPPAFAPLAAVGFAVAPLLLAPALPVWSRLTIIDFHEYESVEKHVSSKSVLWAGQRWAFPEDEEAILSHLRNYVGMNISQLCDLWEPGRLWDEDLQLAASPRAGAMIAECSAELAAHGHLSLQHCLGTPAAR